MPVLFATVDLILLATWWGLTGSGRERLSTSSRVLATLALFFCQVITVSLALAYAGLLSRTSVLAGNAAVAALLAALLVRRCRASGLSLATALSAVPLRPDREMLGSGVQLVLNLLLLTGLLVAMVLTLWRGYLYAPTASDALWYHLPQVVMLQQTGGLFFSPSLPFIDTHPKNIELFFHHIYAYTGSETWLDVGQVPFVALGVAAIASIGRSFRVPRPYALSAAVLFPFAPVALCQLNTAFADIAFTALAIGVIALLLAWYRQRSRLLFTALLWLLGIALGSKSSGATVVAVVGVVTLVAVYLSNRSVKRVILTALLMGAVVVPLGGYAFLRNTIAHGSPTFPFITKVAGIEFPGLYSIEGIPAARIQKKYGAFGALWESWTTVGAGPYTMASRLPPQAKNADPRDKQFCYSGFPGGLGLIWWLLLPSWLAAIGISLWRRSWGLVGLHLLMVLLFAITPYRHWVRYAYHGFAFGVVGFSLLLGALERARWLRTLLVAAAVGCVAHSLLVIYPVRYAGVFDGGSAAEAKRRDFCAWGRGQLLAAPPGIHAMFRYLRYQAKGAPVLLVYPPYDDWKQMNIVLSYCAAGKQLENPLLYRQIRDQASFVAAAAANPRPLVFMMKEGVRRGGYRLPIRANEFYAGLERCFEMVLDTPHGALVRWSGGAGCPAPKKVSTSP